MSFIGGGTHGNINVQEGNVQFGSHTMTGPEVEFGSPNVDRGNIFNANDYKK